MIDQELLAQLSIEAGLSVADDRLAMAIREIPAFQVDGVFNADVYQSRLLAQGRTPKQFENDMRAQMIMGQFPSSIATSAIISIRTENTLSPAAANMRTLTIANTTAGTNTCSSERN